MSENYISVSQISNYIKKIFEAEALLQGVCVYGEISSFNISGGNAYFTLKDENALMNCVMFGIRAGVPKIGDVILAFGSVQYYAKGGRLTFNVSRIQPYGKGVLYENFLKLKQNLEERGFFDPAHKKAIPSFVRRIGVVTSATGAVIQDIRDVTTRRNDTVDIVLYPVKVQGLGAEQEIARAINFFSEYQDIDCVIVARGGGSIEDLQPFNTEVVAVATYNCKKPIVSAVGHETDFTIIDFVSDLRAPTPSAAAELVVWKKEDFKQSILSHVRAMQNRVESMYSDNSNKVSGMFMRIERVVSERLSHSGFEIKNLFERLFNVVSNKVISVENNVVNMLSGLNMLHPHNVLDRGYAIINRGNEGISGVSELKEKDIINVYMRDGSLEAGVLKIIKKGE